MICNPIVCHFSINGNDTDTFRALVFDNDGNVKITPEEMNTYGENKTISRIWWNLTKEERIKIAIKLHDYFKINILEDGHVYYYCEGNLNCEGLPYSIYECINESTCVNNTKARYLKFNGLEVDGTPSSKCYYKGNNLSKLYCFYVSDDKTYHLPCYYAIVTGIIGHAICALLIDKDYKDINNWFFFQYNDSDIKIGDWQIPIETTNVYISSVTSMLYQNTCDDFTQGPCYVWWKIGLNGTPTLYNICEQPLNTMILENNYSTDYLNELKTHSEYQILSYIETPYHIIIFIKEYNDYQYNIPEEINRKKVIITKSL